MRQRLLGKWMVRLAGAWIRFWVIALDGTVIRFRLEREIMALDLYRSELEGFIDGCVERGFECAAERQEIRGVREALVILRRVREGRPGPEPGADGYRR